MVVCQNIVFMMVPAFGSNVGNKPAVLNANAKPQPMIVKRRRVFVRSTNWPKGQISAPVISIITLPTLAVNSSKWVPITV